MILVERIWLVIIQIKTSTKYYIKFIEIRRTLQERQREKAMRYFKQNQCVW